jgi:hypothetical protein
MINGQLPIFNYQLTILTLYLVAASVPLLISLSKGGLVGIIVLLFALYKIFEKRLLLPRCY